VPEGLFDEDGHWTDEAAPADWGDPQAALQDAHFWRVFESCLDHLPPQQARVFMMREFVELDSPEVCSAVGISTSNLHVSLHRARLRLRSCLEQHWFAPGAQPC
jgi:RNA polymerase sigma-70 factor (ECF subfamily)